jgi:hypothetical protein
VTTSADRLWASYLERIGGREMYDRDPGYRYQFDIMRDMLNHLSVVLEDEGIPTEQAERIMRSVLYGTSSVANAEQRMRAHEVMVKLMSERPMSLTLGNDR